MKLYREVLIESAEQADALPIGTLAKDGELSVAVKAEDGHWARTDIADGLPMMDGGSMVGWKALEPIEAEECHSEDYGAYHLMEAIDGSKPFTAYLVDQEEA